jgi:hypothetical protein
MRQRTRRRRGDRDRLTTNVIRRTVARRRLMPQRTHRRTADRISGGPVAGAYRPREVVNQRGMGAQLRQPRGYGGREVMTRHLNRVFCVQPISDPIHGDRPTFSLRPMLTMQSETAGARRNGSRKRWRPDGGRSGRFGRYLLTGHLRGGRFCQPRCAERSQPGTHLRPLASALNSTPGRPAKPSGTSP